MSLVNSFRDRIVAMVADAFPQLVYGSVYEYRIQPSSIAGRFDLLPVRTEKIGELPRLYQWGGPGIEASYAAGASVLVGFIDADHTRPVVIGYMPVRLPGGLPTLVSMDGTRVDIGPTSSDVRIGGGIQVPAARQGDVAGYEYVQIVAGNVAAVYRSALSGAGSIWSAVASGALPPVNGVTAGTPITITTGSSKVAVG